MYGCANTLVKGSEKERTLSGVLKVIVTRIVKESSDSTLPCP